MGPTHRRGRPSLCPTCGELVYLNRNGLYRRHFAVEPNGHRHLCASSGHETADVVRLGEPRRLEP